MSIKLLALDLDGTLTTNLSVIPAKTRQAIKQAMQKGIKVVLATGRAYQIAADIARELELNAPLIANHGGIVRYHQSGETLLANCMSPAVSRRLIKFARKQKLPLVMYMAHDIFTELPSKQMQGIFARENIPLTIVNNLLCLLDDEVMPLKFVFIQSKDQNDAVYKRIESTFGAELTVLRSADTLVEAFKLGISKEKALRVLADHFEIPLSETMAVGDHDNDIGMLQAAGLGVAMGNGSPRAKKVADVIAPPVEEEGVAWTIQTYILDGDHDPDS